MNSEEENIELLPVAFNEIDWDEYELLAGVGYTPEKIAMYFRIDPHLFLSYFMLEGSELKKRYDIGQLQQQAKEGMVALESAQNGNVTQAQRLDKIRKALLFEDQKRKIIYGE